MSNIYCSHCVLPHGLEPLLHPLNQATRPSCAQLHQCAYRAPAAPSERRAEAHGALMAVTDPWSVSSTAPWNTLQLPSFTLCPFKLCPWTSSADLNTFSYRKSITTHNDEASHHHLHKTNPWLLSNLTQLCSHLVHLEWLISVSHVDKSSLAFFWGLSSLLKGSVRASSALLPKSSPISSDCGYRTNAEIE